MTSYKKLTTVFKHNINELFNSNGFECRKLFYGCEVFYCLRDILQCLNSKDDETEILSKINENNKFTIEELQDKYYSFLAFEFYDEINTELISSQTDDELKYLLYINKTALFELIESFEKFEAKPFKDFAYKNLLPCLDNIYKVVIKMNEEKIIEMEKKFREYQKEFVELQHVSSPRISRGSGVFDKNGELFSHTKLLKTNRVHTRQRENRYRRRFFLITSPLFAITSFGFLYLQTK